MFIRSVSQKRKCTGLSRKLGRLEDLCSRLEFLSDMHQEDLKDLLQWAAEQSELQELAVVTSLVRNGDNIRWGPNGWETVKSRLAVRSATVLELDRLKLIESNEGIVSWRQVSTE